MYNPSTGRFNSEDPLPDDPSMYEYEAVEQPDTTPATSPLAPGESAYYSYERRVLGRTHPDDHRGDTNLYRYAGNDPVNWIDPSGLDRVESNREREVYWYAHLRPGRKKPGTRTPKFLIGKRAGGLVRLSEEYGDTWVRWDLLQKRAWDTTLRNYGSISENNLRKALAPLIPKSNAEEQAERIGKMIARVERVAVAALEKCGFNVPTDVEPSSEKSDCKDSKKEQSPPVPGGFPACLAKIPEFTPCPRPTKRMSKVDVVNLKLEKLNFLRRYALECLRKSEPTYFKREVFCYHPFFVIPYLLGSTLFPDTDRAVRNAVEQVAGTAFELGRSAIGQQAALAYHVLRGDFAGYARSNAGYLGGLHGESQAIGFFLGALDRQIELYGAGLTPPGVLYVTYDMVSDKFEEDVDIRFMHVTNALVDCGIKDVDCSVRYALAEKIATATKKANEGPVKRFTRVWLDWFCCLDEHACNRGKAMATVVDEILVALTLSRAVPPTVVLQLVKRLRKAVAKLPKRFRTPMLKKIDDWVAKRERPAPVDEHDPDSAGPSTTPALDTDSPPGRPISPDDDVPNGFSHFSGEPHLLTVRDGDSILEYRIVDGTLKVDMIDGGGLAARLRQVQEHTDFRAVSGFTSLKLDTASDQAIRRLVSLEARQLRGDWEVTIEPGPFRRDITLTRIDN